MITQILWTSIASASFQVLLTLSFALVVRVTGIWNFTQPALMGVAFYSGYVVQHQLDWPVLPSFAVSAVVTVLAAMAIEKFAFARLRARQAEPLLFFIFTLVLAQFSVFLMNLLFTSEPVYMGKNVSMQLLLIEPFIITMWDVTSLACAIGGVLALAGFLRLRVGQHLVAVADNPELAEVFGISKDRLYLIVLGIAGLLIALGTYVYGGKLAFYPDLGPHLMIFAVASTILAGIGRVFGAALAAVVISVMQQASVFFISSHWQPLIVYAVLFIAIILFPSGIRWPAPKLKRRPATQLPTQPQSSEA
jgi:branched-subunit amino acid ABC-type transport system permease component